VWIRIRVFREEQHRRCRIASLYTNSRILAFLSVLSSPRGGRQRGISVVGQGGVKLKTSSGTLLRAAIGGAVALSVFTGGTARTSAQTGAPSSPMGVLQAYRKMDSEGERLTPAGWRRAAKYFFRPEPPPAHIVLHVTEGERVAELSPGLMPKESNRRALGEVMCSALGQIDSSGRFTSLVSPSGTALPGQSGGKLYGPVPLIRRYELILTETHWELGPNLEGPREVTGLREWRIETFEAEPWITAETAIRYLTGLRDGSGREVTRRDAERSIVALRRLLKR
jgi:hypothetical protein